MNVEDQEEVKIRRGKKAEETAEAPNEKSETEESVSIAEALMQDGELVEVGSDESAETETPPTKDEEMLKALSDEVDEKEMETPIEEDDELNNEEIISEEESEEEKELRANAEITADIKKILGESEKTSKKAVKYQQVEQKDEAAAEELDEHDIFRRRSVDVSTKTQRRKAFSEEHIVGDDDDENEDRVETTAREASQELSILTDAAHSDPPQPCQGKIVGIEYLGKDRESPVAIAKLKNSKGLYKIIIPAKFLFDYDPEDEKYKGVAGKAKLYSELEARLGANIEFLPYHTDVVKKYAYASRLNAMSIIGYNNYIYKTKRDGKPRIEPEVKNKRIVRGNITKVNRYGIMVECKGAECFVPKADLDYNGMADASEKFYVGQVIKVLIKKVWQEKVKKNGITINLVKIDASVKEADKKPVDKYFEMFKKDGIYTGTVKRKNVAGKYIVTLNEKLDCVCLPPSFGGTPRIGQECSVKIEDKLEYDGDDGGKNRQLHGKIKILF